MKHFISVEIEYLGLTQTFPQILLGFVVWFLPVLSSSLYPHFIVAPSKAFFPRYFYSATQHRGFLFTPHQRAPHFQMSFALKSPHWQKFHLQPAHLHPQPIHLGGFQPLQSWVCFLAHPNHGPRNPCQRSHQTGKSSLSWSSPAWVCGESSLPSPLPLTLCWRSPRTHPCSGAPCRTTGQPCRLGRAQPCQAAWRVLQPTCFLGERK